MSRRRVPRTVADRAALGDVAELRGCAVDVDRVDLLRARRAASSARRWRAARRIHPDAARSCDVRRPSCRWRALRRRSARHAGGHARGIRRRAPPPPSPIPKPSRSASKGRLAVSGDSLRVESARDAAKPRDTERADRRFAAAADDHVRLAATIACVRPRDCGCPWRTRSRRRGSVRGGRDGSRSHPPPCRESSSGWGRRHALAPCVWRKARLLLQRLDAADAAPPG